MIDLVLDIVFLDKRRLAGRLLGFGLSLLFPLVFVALTVFWASFAAYAALAERFGSLTGSLLLAGCLSTLSIIAAMIFLRRNRRPSPEAVLDGLLASFASQRSSGRRGENDDLVAMALLLADRLEDREISRGRS